jgi:hypothetical protein
MATTMLAKKAATMIVRRIVKVLRIYGECESDV